MKRACVIGWPIEHSRSPLIHRYWLARYGLEGDYDKQAVAPEDFARVLRALPERGYVGANITVPHKQAALALADQADEAARRIGAANTIWFEGDKICASNTDAYGFTANLDERAPGWDKSSRPAAVLGAGGAARAILYGLVERGFREIRLANRTRARAEELAAHIGPQVRVYDWAHRSAMLEGCGFLVNTSTLGMSGAPALEIDLSGLAAGAVVNDIVYVPLETALLAQARARGLRAVDGLGMLLHQAAPGFARWFGMVPEVTEELRALIMADIAKEKERSC